MCTLLYQQLEDYTGCSYVCTGFVNLYMHYKSPRLALTHNDSLIFYAAKSIVAGHQKQNVVANAYQIRGDIFRELKEPDSAWYYLSKGYDMKLSLLNEDTRAQVAEIDARYNDALKQEQIEEQALKLTQKNTQLRSSVFIALLVLLLAAGLAIGLYQQRRGKRQLAAQNALIIKQSEQLKSLDAAKSRFFANVSHELRTPLTLILGPVRTLLKENQLTAKQTQLLQAVHRSGEELRELVNEILDLRKLEMGKMEVSFQPTAWAQFFRNGLRQFDSLAQSKQVEYVTQVADNE